MRKLYRRANKQLHYAEAWVTPEGSVLVHRGVVGDRGETQELAQSGHGDDEARIDQALQRFVSEGYAELDPDQERALVVQLRTDDAWGDGADLDRRSRVERLLNESLGWTGNGYCDGGDIGSGTMNLFCFVVEADIALKTVVEALKSGEIRGAVIAVAGGAGDYIARWPPDYQGGFDLM